MSFIRKNGAGILLCLAIAIPSWIIGQRFPVVGGAVIGILAGMAVTVLWKNKGPAEGGVSVPLTVAGMAECADGEEA